jgi:hypothetical protein
VSLIRQGRLICGVNYFDELSPKLRSAVLLIKEKVGAGATFEDAETLAKYAGLQPGTVAFTEFVLRIVS